MPCWVRAVLKAVTQDPTESSWSRPMPETSGAFIDWLVFQDKELRRAALPVQYFLFDYASFRCGEESDEVGQEVGRFEGPILLSTHGFGCTWESPTKRRSIDMAALHL